MYSKGTKCKAEFALEEVMKDQEGSTGISFFSLGAICAWVINATLRPLYPRNLMYGSEI
jgi:hypothetical protein